MLSVNKIIFIHIPILKAKVWVNFIAEVWVNFIGFVKQIIPKSWSFTILQNATIHGQKLLSYNYVISLAFTKGL